MDSTRVESRRASSSLQLVQVAVGKWELVQVELQGKCSLQRMRAFYAYAVETSWLRILSWCIITPIPGLILNILLDVPPLARPSAGCDANYVFWIRLVIFSLVIAYSMWLQTGFLAPALGLKSRHALIASAVITIISETYMYMLSCQISMPVPFLLLAGAPAFLSTNAAMFGLFFGRRLRNDEALFSSFIRAGGITGIQSCLVLIFPTFIYGYNSISPRYQTPYMILLPAIKLVVKNIMSRIIGSNDDMKPVEMIFNIDCFNAIYVSLAMQRATTISTSLTVMLIDVFQGCVSVYDVYQGFQPLKTFMNQLPAEHPLHGKNFLEVAIALDQEVDVMSRGKETDTATLSGPMFQEKTVKPSISSPTGHRVSTKVFVAPRQTNNQDTTIANVSTQQSIFPSESRAAFLLATRKLLFTTEFVILVEYTEVIMPAFYSILTAATYYLPNRAFYSTIAGIDEQELWNMVTSVLMYSALELVSLVVMSAVVHRIIGMQPMRQVGFVLDTQRVIVQSKMFSWVLYAVQNSLEHFGADSSFQFKWLHSH